MARASCTAARASSTWAGDATSSAATSVGACGPPSSSTVAPIAHGCAWAITASASPRRSRTASAPRAIGLPRAGSGMATSTVGHATGAARVTVGPGAAAAGIGRGAYTGRAGTAPIVRSTSASASGGSAPVTTTIAAPGAYRSRRKRQASAGVASSSSGPSSGWA